MHVKYMGIFRFKYSKKSIKSSFDNYTKHLGSWWYKEVF